MKIKKSVLRQLTFQDCRESGLSLWQCPNFLFLVMGLINISSMLGVYIIVQRYDIPELVILCVSAISVLIFAVGSSVINSFEQVAKANKMKSEFVSIASHQLKAPLSGMRWATDALIGNKNESLTQRQIEYLKDIQENTSRMIRLVNDLLDVSRIETGRMVVGEQEVDLKDTVETVIKELNCFALAQNTKLILKVDDKIKKIKNDPVRIKMVMQNFIDNAIKYIGDKKGEIVISLENREKNVFFSVKDNGLGIPQEERKKIFEKFYRGDNIAKRQTIGTGLGLYIAKAVIDNSKGKIGFNSKEGAGSTFWFTLPAISNSNSNIN